MATKAVHYYVFAGIRGHQPDYLLAVAGIGPEDASRFIAQNYGSGRLLSSVGQCTGNLPADGFAKTEAAKRLLKADKAEKVN